MAGFLVYVHWVKKFRHRGNRAAPAGRRFKDPKVQQQLVCGADDDDDKLYKAPPTNHHKNKRQPHSLNLDIQENRTSARKH